MVAPLLNGDADPDAEKVIAMRKFQFSLSYFHFSKVPLFLRRRYSSEHFCVQQQLPPLRDAAAANAALRMQQQQPTGTGKSFMPDVRGPQGINEEETAKAESAKASQAGIWLITHLRTSHSTQRIKSGGGNVYM